MSENAKLPEKRQDFLSLPRDDNASPQHDSNPAAEPAHMQDVEAQMRRALGLFGAPRRQEQDRPAATPAPRPADPFRAGHGHKRRFVQDGEVPVTVLHGRREHAGDVPQNRLEAAEAALNNEHALRERAERALAEANASIHDLQTKLGHANLAHTEHQQSVRRDQETIAALRAELQQLKDHAAAAESAQHHAEERVTSLQEQFAAEREARLEAERNLRVAEVARDNAEQLVRDLDLDSQGPIDLPARRPGRPARVTPEAKPRPTKVRAARATEEAGPEPVQWWLMPAKKTRRK